MATFDSAALACSSTAWRPDRSNAGAGVLNSRGFPFGAPSCRIYRPSPSVMQSGRAPVQTWVLEFEPFGHRWIEPLMGWTSSDDPFAQVRLSFPTLAAAVDYAERQGLDYRVVGPPVQRWRRKSYPGTGVGAAA